MKSARYGSHLTRAAKRYWSVPALLIIFIVSGIASEEPVPTPTVLVIPPLAPDVSVSAAALYRLNYLMGKGMEYQELTHRVRGLNEIRTAEDLIRICRELGYTADISREDTVALLAKNTYFLAKNPEGNWLLYEVRDRKITSYSGLTHSTTIPLKDLADQSFGELVLVALEQFNPGEEPQIKFEETAFDFGPVVQGTRLEHYFTFTNVGKSDLRILKVSSSCGCTAGVVENDKQFFASEETGRIKVTVDTIGKSAAVDQKVRIQTNDVKQPVATVTIKAQLQIPVKVEPSSIYLGRVRKGVKTVKQIRVSSDIRSDFKILSLECASPWIRISTETVERMLSTPTVGESTGPKTKREYVINAEIDPGEMEYFQQLNGEIILKTDVEECPKPEIRISISGTVSGDLYVSPSIIQFGPMKPDQSFEQTIIVRNDNPDFKLEITGVECANKNIKFGVKPTTEGKTYIITATFNAGPDPKPFNDEILINTNHPIQSILKTRARALSSPRDRVDASGNLPPDSRPIVVSPPPVPTVKE